MLPLESVPNFSEGRDRATIDAIGAALAGPARLLDVHADADHNRSVFTCVGDPDSLVEALAAGIAAATSTCAIFLINICVYRERFVLPPRKISYWFMASGICTGGSFLFVFLALSMETVSIIAPLINSYAVFVLLLTPFMARQIETVTSRKVAGAALVVAGIFFISAGRG